MSETVKITITITRAQPNAEDCYSHLHADAGTSVYDFVSATQACIEAATQMDDGCDCQSCVTRRKALVEARLAMNRTCPSEKIIDGRAN